MLAHNMPLEQMQGFSSERLASGRKKPFGRTLAWLTLSLRPRIRFGFAVQIP